jgi:predicted RNase H-like nuclease (RuvC/YqgF family)
MVRAEMAASMARTGHDLKLEREKALHAVVARDEMAVEAARLHSDNAGLVADIETMKTEAAELRSNLRNEEIVIANLRETISTAGQETREKDGRIEELLHRAYRLGVEVDNLKIELASRDTEIEGMKARVNGLRDERETLREDLRLMSSRAKEAERHLSREETKAKRLEEKLNEELTSSVDKDTILERRMGEISKLRDKIKSGDGAKPVGVQTVIGKTVLIDKTGLRSDPAPLDPAVTLAKSASADGSQAPARMIDDGKASEIAESILLKSAALSDDLLTFNPSKDDEMREELADIAARMVAVVGQGEGASSPIRAMISGKPAPGANGRISLAFRSRKILFPDP